MLTGTTDVVPFMRAAPALSLADFSAVAHLVFSEAAAYQAAAGELEPDAVEG
jgi:hypothetical protein